MSFDANKNAPIALPRPQAGEFDAAAAAYIDRVPTIADAWGTLATQRDSVVTVFSTVSDTQAAVRYAPDKWSVREVVGHLADAERIFAYRLLRVGRGDSTPLPGFDENMYVPAGAFERRRLADVLEEWVAVRDASLALVRGMPADAWTRRGVANGKTVSAGALVYVMLGHVEHHRQVLAERYVIGK